MRIVSRKTPSLALVTVLVAALGILVPIVIFFLGLRSKDLSFGVVVRSALVDLLDSSLTDLTVSFRGEEIERVESLTLRFENSGNTPIESRDFDRAMMVALADGSRILSASVAEAVPESLEPVISTTDALLSVEPLLLNPGDRFSVTLVVGGDPGLPELNARVSGIRRVTHLDPPRSREHVHGLQLGGLGVLGLLIYFYLGGLFGPIGIGRSREVPWLDGLVVALMSAMPAAGLLVAAGRSFELELWRQFAILAGLMLVSVPVYFIARRRVRLIAAAGEQPATNLVEGDA